MDIERKKINHYQGSCIDGKDGIYYGNKDFKFGDSYNFKLGTDIVDRPLQEHEKDMIDNTVKPNFYKCECCDFMTCNSAWTVTKRYDNMRHHIKTKKHKKKLKEYIDNLTYSVCVNFEKISYNKMLNEAIEQKK